MKKTFQPSAVFAILLSTGMLTASPSLFAQIPCNGSFEFTDRQYKPAKWFFNLDGPASYTYSIDSTVSYEGRYSLLVTPTESYGDYSTFTSWQQIDVHTLPPFKTVKTVLYVKSDSLAPSIITTGVTFLPTEPQSKQSISFSYEKVYNESGLWYKVTRICRIQDACQAIIPWIDLYHNDKPMYLDNIQIFLDDKRLADLPLDDKYYPSSADISWLKTNSREIHPASTTDNTAWLTDETRNATIIALGESTHGTSASIQLRSAISRLLIQKAGFSVIAIDDKPSGLPGDEKELKAFLGWVHRYNATSGKKITVVKLSDPLVPFDGKQIPISITPSIAEENNRDSLLAGNIQRLSQPGKKILIWTSNKQISRALNLSLRDDPAYNSRQTLGARLDAAYHEKYKCFALLAANPTTTANPPTTEEPPTDSYEYYLKTANKTFFYITMDTTRTEIHRQLFEHLRWYDLGYDYPIPTYQFKFYNLYRNFDGLFLTP